jgi:membrane protease subunit (stomatin/prohibitin family)
MCAVGSATRSSTVQITILLRAKVYHRECLKPGQAPELPAANSRKITAMKKVAVQYCGGEMSPQLLAALERTSIKYFHLLNESELETEASAENCSAETWRCPWHFCNECGQTAHKGCAKCPVSYCHVHGNSEGCVPYPSRELTVCSEWNRQGY